MSKDMQDDTNTSSKNKVTDKFGDRMGSALFEKSSTLAETANNTFQELCHTLEAEHIKLLELEERRVKLQQEMQQLKRELEYEKKMFNSDLLDTGADGGSEDSSTASYIAPDRSGTESIRDFIERQHAEVQQMCSPRMPLPPLQTCYEEEEEDDNNEDCDVDGGSQSDIKPTDIVADNIHKELQSVVAECIIEQCKTDNSSDAADEPGTSKRRFAF